MANVTFTPNHVPAPACYPADVNGMLDLITTGGGLNGTIPDQAGGGIYVGSTPPSSALTNKVWYKTDGAGRPLGVFMFYNGNWRKVYTGLAPGEIRIWAGATNEFDGSGRGVIGGNMDGWALCNGANGTPNMEGYFVCGGVWGPSVGLGTAWFANPDGTGLQNAGGQRAQTFVTNNNLPPQNTEFWWRQLGLGSSGSAPLLVADFNGSVGYLPVVDQTDKTQGHGQPLPFPILWLALAYIEFVGYA